MTVRPFFSCLIPLVLLGPGGLRAHAAAKVVSLFPLGGQRGTALEVEIRGAGLDGAYAVWLGPGSRLDPASGGTKGFAAAVLSANAHLPSSSKITCR